MGTAFKWVQDREKLLLEKARPMQYKEIADAKNLSIHFYLPKDLKAGPKRPLILFFNDGGWDRGNVIQFAPQALYYVERGAVCGLVEYRNRSSHPESTPLHSLEDGRSAIQFSRQHVETLHVDPEKVVAAGAGAGANIAGGVSLSAVSPPDDSEHEAMDCVPNAAVLISGIIEVTKDSYGYDQFPDPADSKRVNLLRYATSVAPPMLVLHGTADRIAPIERAAEFAALMKRKKADCEFVEFEGRDHSFFNLNFDPISYEASLTYIDGFLDRIGILKVGENEEGARIISRDEEDY